MMKQYRAIQAGMTEIPLYISPAICDALYEPAIGCERGATGLGWSLCVPSSMPDGCVMDAEVVRDGCPKGAGVSTTAQRYSRKMHRQSDSFSAPSLSHSAPNTISPNYNSPIIVGQLSNFPEPGGYSYPISIISLGTIFPFWGSSDFLDPPGVLTTRKSNLCSYNRTKSTDFGCFLGDLSKFGRTKSTFRI